MDIKMKRYRAEVKVYERDSQQGDFYTLDSDVLHEVEIFMFAKTANLDSKTQAFKATLFDNGKEATVYTNDLNNV